MATNNYYSDSTWINTKYAADIALENHYTNMIFQNQPNRIVYSRDQYAFRQRSIQTTKLNNTQVSLQTLDLPFLNYHGTPVVGTDRKYWKQELNSSGIFIEELGYKIKATPITLNYEATFYFHKESDNLQAFEKLAWDESNETQINYDVLVDSEAVSNIGILGYNLDYDGMYTENDWLDRNNIHTVKADFELQTFILKGNTTGFGLVDQCILDFYTLHGIEDDVEDHEQIITDYFSS